MISSFVLPWLLQKSVLLIRFVGASIRSTASPLCLWKVQLQSLSVGVCKTTNDFGVASFGTECWLRASEQFWRRMVIFHFWTFSSPTPPWFVGGYKILFLLPNTTFWEMAFFHCKFFRGIRIVDVRADQVGVEVPKY